MGLGDWAGRLVSKVLGTESAQDSEKARNELLRRMVDREGQLYPELMALMENDPAYAEQIFGAATGEANRLYGGVQRDINNFTMPPEALAQLENIRRSRVDSISGDVDRLVGSKISDYARRGVTSSSTAEGMGREVGQAIAPTIDKANQDYYQARLDMPSKLAMQRYSLGVGQGALNAEALKNKRDMLVNPYLDMWKTTSGAATGNTPTNQTGQSNANALGAISNLVGKLYGNEDSKSAS